MIHENKCVLYFVCNKSRASAFMTAALWLWLKLMYQKKKKHIQFYSNCVVLLDCVYVQSLELNHRLHVPFERVQFPKPAMISTDHYLFE